MGACKKHCIGGFDKLKSPVSDRCSSIVGPEARTKARRERRKVPSYGRVCPFGWMLWARIDGKSLEERKNGEVEEERIAAQ